MNHFFKQLFILVCFVSSFNLSATPNHQIKLYFNSNDLEFSENVIFIRLENELIETNVIRTDQLGFYIFENDITNYEIAREIEKKWKCPYCHHWWPNGQKCQNPECPTNKW